jgi:selenocysteine lyase/cysteine desulfurase
MNLKKDNTNTLTGELEEHFQKFRNNIIGCNCKFTSPYGEKNLVYADWTASGRIYGPIEDKIKNLFAPFVGNTHTETNITGTSMTLAYHEAKVIIKKHVNASEDDAIICTGSGMTAGVVKLQRMLGFKIPGKAKKYVNIPDEEHPVIFITHMEHHSNQTTWLETTAKVEIIDPDSEGKVELSHLEELLEKYKDYKYKIASVISCSNVTGVFADYYKIAEIMHKHGGLCFVDFACSAPYIYINMHPENPLQKLDAIFFSPHKFLGGPGSTGVLIFDKSLYNPEYAPDTPGGGTVKWTNPWGEHHYYDDIETREDGGTPAFLQTIKASLAIKLKEEMNPALMMKREDEIRQVVFQRLHSIHNLHVLANNIKERLLVFSFYIDDLHYNLGVKLLNDKFGIQVRGGCSCAGTYGHYLLHVSKHQSRLITNQIDHNDLSAKPGWIRVSMHPVATNEEILYILDSIEELAANFKDWAEDYEYDKCTNYFTHKSGDKFEKKMVDEWFNL